MIYFYDENHHLISEYQNTGFGIDTFRITEAYFKVNPFGAKFAVYIEDDNPSKEFRVYKIIRENGKFSVEYVNLVNNV